MAFFRPPYFGDAEPTTSDELVPVGIASRRHYWTIGLHVDSEDWRESNPDSIIANVLREREHPRVSEATRQDSTRNVVLLHDSGGDRSATVAALGPLIDSLRARGDTLVLVSDLAGISRDEAMPPLPPTTEATRFFVRTGFVALGLGETLDVLGVQRRRGARHRAPRRHRRARPDRAAARPPGARRSRATTRPA